MSVGVLLALSYIHASVVVCCVPGVFVFSWAENYVYF